MNESAFLDFITSAQSGARGGATYNLATRTCSKAARAILAKTQYKALAKQSISAQIVKAYKHNAEFQSKLDDVMAQHNIVVVAPRDDDAQE